MSEGFEHFPRPRQLPFTAIDQKHIGKRAGLTQSSKVMALQRLCECGIVIPRRYAQDTETAVAGFHGSFRIENYTRSERRFSARMTDIEAFHTLDRCLDR